MVSEDSVEEEEEEEEGSGDHTDSNVIPNGGTYSNLDTSTYINRCSFHFYLPGFFF